jgi:hypothetical protein
MVFVLGVISLVCSVRAGDIVHEDDLAPKKPGCANDFVLVRAFSLIPISYFRDLTTGSCLICFFLFLIKYSGFFVWFSYLENYNYGEYNYIKFPFLFVLIWRLPRNGDQLIIVIFFFFFWFSFLLSFWLMFFFFFFSLYLLISFVRLKVGWDLVLVSFSE